MKILLVGSGGREHALAWKLAQSDKVEHIFVAPGNAGTANEQKSENVNLHTIDELLGFAKENQIDLTVVGPEALLVEGIADVFTEAGLPIFAPKKAAAALEGSKRFAKEFMARNGVKTAEYQSFDVYEDALKYLQVCPYPTVLKASGLAAGKGVVICQDQNEAKVALQDMMLNEKFGSAGAEVVIEQFLEGWEASILSVCDGTTILPFISAKDHKKIGEGEVGLNTGGMGVIAPNPLFGAKYEEEFITQIVSPTIAGLQKEKIDFTGVIFFGLMITKDGVYLLEYNTRFGDPETQAVLPLLETELIDVVQACVEKKLKQIELHWKDAHSCCVVAASGGYPEAYEKGKEVKIDSLQNAQVFMAGVKQESDKQVTSGGRVLNVVATGASLDQARAFAYADIYKVHFDQMVYRTDIGVLNQSNI